MVLFFYWTYDFCLCKHQQNILFIKFVIEMCVARALASPLVVNMIILTRCNGYIYVKYGCI